MATFKKLMLRTEVYQPAGGELNVTPERARSLVAKFKQMKRAGLKVPVSWGHQPGAWPDDPSLPATDDRLKAVRQYWISRFNAGYVEDVSFDDKTGELSFAFDAPGLECQPDGSLVAWAKHSDDGPLFKTAIKEVSAAIKNFKDGKGRLWPEALIHVALTPLPVVDSQPGFSPAELNLLRGADDDGGFYLSLAPNTAEKPMAEDTGKKGDEAATGKGDLFGKGLKFLASKGIKLPDDTDEKNIWERLEIIAAALAPDETPAPPPEPEPEEPKEDDEEGEGEGDNPMADLEKATADGGPIMLSLATADTPALRKMVAKEQDRHKAAQLKKIDRLVARGLSPARAQKLRDEITGYELSLDPEELTPVDQNIDVLLSALDEALPRASLLKAQAGATAAPHPGRPTGPSDAEVLREIEERAKAISRVQ